MRTSITTNRDGSVVMQLDREAAQATFASVQFASRFHEQIAALSTVTERELAKQAEPAARRPSKCQ